MKIAIIGTGISGNGAAYLLNRAHDITLYEKNDYIGGHSRTKLVNTPDGPIAVDTGFIVFNYRNYPLLTGLFDHLDVPVAKSDMSFGVSIDNGWLEYGTQYTKNIFAQPSNVFKPDFWRMVRDIFRFNKQAHQYLDKDPSISLGQCLDELGMGQWFRDYFLLAMGGAIWSTPLEQMLEFPAATFIRFFDNHGLLTVNDQPQWYTVQGGSKEYVSRLTESFKDRIKLGCGAKSVHRVADGVEVADTLGRTETYDQVVFACHSDQALAMLQNPSKIEREIIGGVAYQENKVVLHSDVSFMPKRKGAWASWVYLSEQRKDERPTMCLSYWMNKLQPLNTNTNIIVTLNPARMPKPELTHDVCILEHPVFDRSAIEAQGRLAEIQGHERIWWCGAWQRYGFHEDGLLSAVNVAKGLGADVPWT